tara:strand:- start:25990 stop:26349 length:360 start_codon:yes stop_codon:yes gene_type:complete
MLKLKAPDSYYTLSAQDKAQICNGMGAKDSLISSFIPNTFYGLDMTECGNIHDYMYHIGKTEDDKNDADRTFLSNMIKTINAKSRNGFMRWIRRSRAMKYYTAVAEAGNTAYWAGKKPH